jgi:hypothetical protein
VADGHIVEEQERLGTLRKHVVHAHGHCVYTDGVVAVKLESYFQLCAHTVGAAHQNRVTVSERAEVEHASESTDATHAAGASGGSHMLLDAAHHLVSGFEVHTRSLITFCHISRFLFD